MGLIFAYSFPLANRFFKNFLWFRKKSICGAGLQFRICVPYGIPFLAFSRVASESLPRECAEKP